jgi:hypothetical protein
MIETLEVRTDPMVQLVEGSGEPVVIPFGDLAVENEDPATVSDSRVIALVERFLDRSEGSLSRMCVTRPSTGNIVLREANLTI